MLLVPGDDIPAILRIMIALPVRHKSVPRREKPVATCAGFSGRACRWHPGRLLSNAQIKMGVLAGVLLYELAICRSYAHSAGVELRAKPGASCSLEVWAARHHMNVV
jgi:hypothetical protein